jgi:hypothetical protein
MMLLARLKLCRYYKAPSDRTFPQPVKLVPFIEIPSGALILGFSDET